MVFHFAQINIARFRMPMEHPANAEFIGSLDRVNAIAEQQPGFVWRFTGEGNNALDVKAYEDPNVAVNMSLWTDFDALTAFVFRNEAHGTIMRRRTEWFEKLEFYMALWWVAAGRILTVEDGKARIEHLRTHGPSPFAFTFKSPFPAPGAGNIAPVLDECA